MNTSTFKEYEKTEVVPSKETSEAFVELQRSVIVALETYSNVHRGSGHNSMVTTHLFEQARIIVLDYLGLNKGKYMVVFCSPRRAKMLTAMLGLHSFQSISGEDIGLSLGVSAVAVNRKSLPAGIPFQTGGGTAKLIARDWVIWGKAPDKFEAGTPAIVNIIAFAKGLQLFRKFGNDAFQIATSGKLSAHEILNHDELEAYSGKELLAKLRETLIGKGIQVPTSEGIQPFINLDNGASTPTFRPVWDAVYMAWQQSTQVKKDIIHEVRTVCSEILGAPSDIYDTLFTSNTTEAINLVAESLSKEPMHEIEPVVLNTVLEHNSNELPWRLIPGVSLIRLSVDTEGFMDLNELEMLLHNYNHSGSHGKKRIKLVTVSGASNVLGVYNDLAAIGKIVHRYGARLMVDAAQLVAHRKVSMELCAIDYLVFSAHKVYAPFGTGVLMARKGLLAFNNTEMEIIHSSGEENIGGIAGLGKSLILLQRIGLDIIQEDEQLLTREILRGLKQIPGLTLFGIEDEKSPKFKYKGGVVIFNLKRYMANQLAEKLANQGGIGVRSGCHCAHIIVKQMLQISPSLERFQYLIFTLFPRLTPPGVTRVSIGLQNNKEEIDKLLLTLNRISRKPQSDNQHSKASFVSSREYRQQMEDLLNITAERVYGIVK